MRPTASFSGTRSASVTSESFSFSSASAAADDISSPPKAKQSSLSCATVRYRDVEMSNDEIGDRADIVERETGQLAQPGDRQIGGDGDDIAILGREQRLADRGAIDFELRHGGALESL